MKEPKIIFEDEDLLVIDKPEGLPSVSTHDPARGGNDIKETTAHSFLASRQSSGRVFVVHRLDRDTSGVMIFAKTQDTKEALQQYWDEAVLERKYVALVEGVPQKEEGTFTSWLSDNPKSMKVRSSNKAGDGKKAITHYKLLGSFPAFDYKDAKGSRKMRYSLVEFELETGRKNQIRVHASQMGIPVAGDKKYGALTNPVGRLGLHARTIAFIHPWSGETLRFESPLPKVVNL
ncbi:MAG: RluA family pseudouridine synthase [Bacteroidales bacterium]|nr:RluA family pseudouridine synthase [Bacteroidales bacterium]